MKKFKDWPGMSQVMFVLDIVCVILVTSVLMTSPYTGPMGLIGFGAIVLCTIGATGIFVEQNPGSIKG